ncbi:MAG: NAD kinase [Prevotellaceae bacterium]|jgi:NAD+ kinase|nr:NAD kinase [Prevotellaceae bacterium]
MTIAIYGRAFTADCSAQVRALLALLEERRIDFSIYAPFYAFLQQSYAITIPRVTLFHALPPVATDCLVSIGGDGTFLGSLQHVRNSGIPVAGINCGRLGFLSSASFDDLPEALDALGQKQYTIEERTLLEVCCDGLPDTIYPYALNEIGVQRHTPAMISIHVRINDDPLPAYWADGLLVATPTGSTAYSMSVGGPILVPEAKNFVLSPISPHNLHIRSLVVTDDTVLTLTVETRHTTAFLTVDNQLVEIPSGAQFVIRKAAFTVRIVRLHGAKFFDTIREKLSWGKDYRNPY